MLVHRLAAGVSGGLRHLGLWCSCRHSRFVSAARSGLERLSLASMPRQCPARDMLSSRPLKTSFRGDLPSFEVEHFPPSRVPSSRKGGSRIPKQQLQKRKVRPIGRCLCQLRRWRCRCEARRRREACRFPVRARRRRRPWRALEQGLTHCFDAHPVFAVGLELGAMLLDPQRCGRRHPGRRSQVPFPLKSTTVGSPNHAQGTFGV